MGWYEAASVAAVVVMAMECVVLCYYHRTRSLSWRDTTHFLPSSFFYPGKRKKYITRGFSMFFRLPHYYYSDTLYYAILCNNPIFIARLSVSTLPFPCLFFLPWYFCMTMHLSKIQEYTLVSAYIVYLFILLIHCLSWKNIWDGLAFSHELLLSFWGKSKEKAAVTTHLGR